MLEQRLADVTHGLYVDPWRFQISLTLADLYVKEVPHGQMKKCLDVSHPTVCVTSRQLEEL